MNSCMRRLIFCACVLLVGCAEPPQPVAEKQVAVYYPPDRDLAPLIDWIVWVRCNDVLRANDSKHLDYCIGTDYWYDNHHRINPKVHSKIHDCLVCHKDGIID